MTIRLNFLLLFTFISGLFLFHNSYTIEPTYEQISGLKFQWGE